MDDFHRKLILSAYKLLDLLILSAAFLLAASVESTQFQSLSFREILEMRFKVENFLLFVLLLGIWHALFLGFGVYRDRMRPMSLVAECRDLFKASAAATGAMVVFAWVFDILLVSLLFTAVFWPAAAAGLIESRLILRLAAGRLKRRPLTRRHLLLAGTNRRALALAEKIRGAPELGYVFKGFVDEDWSGASRARQAGYEVVSDFQGLSSYLGGQVVDEIISVLPLKSMYSEAALIFSIASRQGIVFRHAPDLFTGRSDRLRGDYVVDVPVVTHYPGVLPGFPLAAKRALDILVSSALLTFLWPLLLLLGLLVKADSRGPMLFVQERVGLNKRRFKLYKFRTMDADAEGRLPSLEDRNEADGPAFKIEDDPRVTRVGKWLRKASADELPQLVNVLKGDMSLVGPRPLPLRDYEGFDKDWHRRRLSVKPGITCLWQIQGRTLLSFEQWMRLDMEYIDRWTLWLDMKILIRTIPAVLSGAGAA